MNGGVSSSPLDWYFYLLDRKQEKPTSMHESKKSLLHENDSKSKVRQRTKPSKPSRGKSPRSFSAALVIIKKKQNHSSPPPPRPPGSLDLTKYGLEKIQTRWVLAAMISISPLEKKKIFFFFPKNSPRLKQRKLLPLRKVSG